MCPFYFLIYILGNIGIGTGGQRAMAPRFYDNLSIGIRFCPCKSTLLSLCDRPRLECFLGYCLLRHSMYSTKCLLSLLRLSTEMPQPRTHLKVCNYIYNILLYCLLYLQQNFWVVAKISATQTYQSLSPYSCFME